MINIMYKNLTVKYYKKILHLSANYRVEGFLSYGGYGPKTHLKRLEKTLKKLQIKYKLKKLDNFLENVYELTINNKIYWFSVIYGNTVLSEYIHFACIFGSKKNIHIGSCGGLNRDINSADLIIPTYSYGDESTTRMYQKNNKKNTYYSDKKLSQNLKNRISKNFSVYSGPIMTVQAMLAETKQDIIHWAKAGYFGIEMETSTLFAVSRHFKVPATAALYVSDNLIKGQTAGDKKHVQEKKLRKRAKDEIYKIAILELTK